MTPVIEVFEKCCENCANDGEWEIVQEATPRMNGCRPERKCIRSSLTEASSRACPWPVGPLSAIDLEGRLLRWPPLVPGVGSPKDGPEI